MHITYLIFNFRTQYFLLIFIVSVYQCPGYTPGKLESTLTSSLCCIARVLHYFAMDSGGGATGANDEKFGKDLSTKVPKDTDFSNWCGWHNDHVSEK